jgi:hypothetical protein
MLEDPSVSTQTQWRLATNSYMNKSKSTPRKAGKESWKKYLLLGIPLILLIILGYFYLDKI